MEFTKRLSNASEIPTYMDKISRKQTSMDTALGPSFQDIKVMRRVSMQPKNLTGLSPGSFKSQKGSHFSPVTGTKKDATASKKEHGKRRGKIKK